MPELWQRLDIIVTARDYEDDLANKVQLVREWIERSKSRPLTVSVQPLGQSYGYCSPLPVFNVLADYSKLLKDLYLHTTDDCLHMLNRNVRGHIPYLESLVITRDRNAFSTPITLDFISDAPLLRVLVYERLGLPRDRNPWPKLTRLAAHGNLDEPFHLGQLSPKLEYLRFGAHVNYMPMVTIPLRFLKSLVIDGTMRTLHHFDVPALESLVLINPDRHDHPLQALIDFMDRTQCDLQLRSLGIGLNFAFDVEALRSILSRTVNIRHLYIGSFMASDYRALTRKIPSMLDPKACEEDVLLPKLETLHYYTVDPVRSADMLNMIKNRWHGSIGLSIGAGKDMAKLRKVRFAKWDEEVLAEKLKAELKQGLEVTYDLSYFDDPF